MIKTIVLSIVVLLIIAIAVVLLLAANKPDSFDVKRSTTIKAPPEKIFALINDFHAWPTWSPYETRDPAMKRTFSGTPSGKGTIYEWDGNNKVGSGRMEILETTVPNKIVIKLDFFKPFEGHNQAVFTMVSGGDTTQVTWAMLGPARFITKVMQVFMDFDDMVGRDFATGLDNLKRIAEK